jgi:hypothetical protein
MTAAIAAADPAVRVTLRGTPVIVGVILSDLLVRALTIANAVPEPFARDIRPAQDVINQYSDALDRARRLVRDLALTRNLDCARDLVHALDLARDLVHARSLDHAPVRALFFGRDLVSVLGRDLASTLASALTHDREFVRDLARDLAHAVDRTLLPDRDLARELAYARVLNRDPDLASAFDPTHAFALDLDLTRALDHDRDLARALHHDHNLARDLAIILDRDQAGDLARRLIITLDQDRNLNLARDLARDLAHHVALVVSHSLGARHAEGLPTALMDGALDDFTRANLAHVALTDLDLTGARWSASDTRWPPGTDLNALRARSREVAPGTGIYVITSWPPSAMPGCR